MWTFSALFEYVTYLFPLTHISRKSLLTSCCRNFLFVVNAVLCIAASCRSPIRKAMSSSGPLYNIRTALATFRAAFVVHFELLPCRSQIGFLSLMHIRGLITEGRRRTRRLCRPLWVIWLPPSECCEEYEAASTTVRVGAVWCGQHYVGKMLCFHRGRYPLVEYTLFSLNEPKMDL